MAGAQLDTAARQAIAQTRSIIDMKDVPQSPDAILPAGYARLDQAARSGNTVNVTLWLGPIPKHHEGAGAIQLDCGSGHTYELKLGSDGHWVITNRGVMMC